MSRERVRQAVILAAGRGSRLGPSINGSPKCLVEVGGRPLIKHQIRTLERFGVTDVAVVVGFNAEAVRAQVGERCEFIDNPRWAETNSLYSLSLASRWVSGPFLVANADVLAHPRVFSRLLSGPPTALAYDSSSGGEPEHMKVSLDNGALRSISKELPMQATDGENLGLLRFGDAVHARLFREARALLRGGNHSRWAPEVLNRLATKVDIHGVDVAGTPWIEIDFPEDLHRARREVWPQIASSPGFSQGHAPRPDRGTARGPGSTPTHYAEALS